MKTPQLVSLCIFALSAPVAFALIGSSDYLPVKINQTVNASYPLSMEAAGIRSGIARCPLVNNAWTCLTASNASRSGR